MGSCRTTQGAQPGALWQPRGVGWGEVGGRFKREGIYVYLWLIHIAIWQKPTQHCKAIIFQLKINKGLPWWLRESICQCKRHEFDPWARKIPRAMEQLSPWATTTEPIYALESGTRNYWAHVLWLLKPEHSRACAPQQERPSQWAALPTQLDGSPCSPQPEKKVCTQQRRSNTAKNILHKELDKVFLID